jgi:hypothetical protein
LSPANTAIKRPIQVRYATILVVFASIAIFLLNVNYNYRIIYMKNPFESSKY